MMFRKSLIAIACAAAFCLATATTSDAIVCEIGPATIDCDTGTVTIYFGSDATGSCALSNVSKIYRRPAGGSNWYLVNGNATSPFSENPPTFGGGGGSWDYKLVEDCPTCDDSDELVVSVTCD